MYSEKSFKSYIFWIQVKRVVVIILMSIIGAALGVGIGAILKGTINVSTYNSLIVVCTTVLFFLLSLLITSGTGKSVQDGYWKIAVLRKLTAIQKTLESNNELLAKDDKFKIAQMKEATREIMDDDNDLVEDVKQGKKKKDKSKTIKAPEIK